jgi:hypothetical protein
MPNVRLHETSDPVVVYDLMREAANRLIARYAGRRTAEGLAASDIAEIRAIRAHVAAVNPADVEAQRRVTAELRIRTQTFV